MKLKMNKASDLSSISVLPPPQPRRPSIGATTGLQGSQHRTQPSQQLFSQGFSSQHGLFSQFSQSSIDEPFTNEQRFASQERENSVKIPLSKSSSINYAQEESQIPQSRSSANMIRKWNPPSVLDHACHINEELEHRIGQIETSINRFGIILDSVQSDVMQVNKGKKEILMELEGLRQKVNVQEITQQLMIKGQEDIKASVQGGLKSVSDQMSKDTNQDKLQDILLAVSSLSKNIGGSLLKLQNELCSTFVKEIQQEMPPAQRINNREASLSSVLPPKSVDVHTAPQRKGQDVEKRPDPLKVWDRLTLVPKKEIGGSNLIKLEENTSANKPSYKELRRKASVIEQERILIESDEEIDGGFSCLLNEKQTGLANCSADDANEETRRILRRARRRRLKKSRNTIIIN
ncbi:hypothetical protein ACFE04_018885 [Oxalis oulophora]